MGVGIGVKSGCSRKVNIELGRDYAADYSEIMKEVMNEMPAGIDVRERSSKVLMDWFRGPRVDMALGRKGLLEVAVRCNVELGRDYAADYSEIMRNHRSLKLEEERRGT
jgi:hypothetical protein